ncbi:MAG: hypothetical protein ACRENK_15540 [Gemmatimonadaceae bacterium]
MIVGTGLLGLFVQLVILGLIFYVLWWALGRLALPEPFAKIATVILVVIIVIVLLNILLGISGSAPLFTWRR